MIAVTKKRRCLLAVAVAATSPAQREHSTLPSFLSQVLAAAARYASEEAPLRIRFFREGGVDSLPPFAAAALQVAALGGACNAAASAAAFRAHAATQTAGIPASHMLTSARSAV